MKTLEGIDAALDALEAWVPVMIKETGPSSHIDAFAGRADLITFHVPPEFKDHAWNRTQCILRDNGLIPGDEEPCSK